MNLPLTIKQTAARTGVPVKTIRYYEDIELISPKRSANGYRVFETNDLHKLAFLGRARSLGFSISDCRALLALYEDSTRASADVREIANNHLSRISDKMSELAQMYETLSHLVSTCAGNDRPDCPILQQLGDDEAPVPDYDEPDKDD